MKKLTTYKVMYRGLADTTPPTVSIKRDEVGVHAGLCRTYDDAVKEIVICENWFNKNERLDPASLQEDGMPKIVTYPPTQRVETWIDEYEDGELKKSNDPHPEGLPPCDDEQKLRERIAALEKEKKELEALVLEESAA